MVTQMLSISTVAATHEADFSQTGWHWGINGWLCLGTDAYVLDLPSQNLPGPLQDSQNTLESLLLSDIPQIISFCVTKGKTGKKVGKTEH